jgi:CheY-like chemotaxis protein
VTLWLPEAPDDVGAARGGAPSGDKASDGSGRILLVDDEQMIREVLGRQLQDAGFSVLTVADGEEALSIAAAERIDAVVTDLSMPGLDGLAVIRSLQSRQPGLPAVLLTGYAGDETSLALSGAMSGAFSLLRKPVSDTQLIDRVRALLAARPAVRR